MNGLHLTADLSGCPVNNAAFTAPEALRTLCLAAVHEAGLTPVGELFHRFVGAGGVTGVVLLAESHLAVHTWPELGAITLDVYVCNFSANNTAPAQHLLSALLAHFHPTHVERHAIERGTLPPLNKAP